MTKRHYGLFKPRVRLKNNRLEIELPSHMSYIAEALEVVLPGVLHKFAVHIEKGDWMINGLTVQDAMTHLHQEIEELKEALGSKSPQEVMMEASDVINQALIIGTLFRGNNEPERRPLVWYGRNFIARGDGEIEFADGIKKGCVVKFTENKKGYHVSSIWGLNTKRGFRTSHRSVMILTAFSGPKPSSNMEADHKNGLVWDDRPNNLQWLDKPSNSAQGGRYKKGRT